MAAKWRDVKSFLWRGRYFCLRKEAKYAKNGRAVARPQNFLDKKDMKRIVTSLFCAGALVLALSGGAMAQDVADLTSGLTRTHADKHFRKDYVYRILEDNTVRRTWQAEGKSIAVDFDIRSDKAIAIFIDYKPAAEKRTALADVKALTEGRRDDAKWSKTKKEAVEKVGLKKNTRLMRLNDKSLLFWESGSKEKCNRLCWFATAPKMDRMTLGDANEFSGRTAMGSSGMAGAAKQLRADEERRMRIEPTPVGGTAVAVATPTPTPRPAATPKPSAEPTRPVQRPAAPVAVAPTQAELDDLDQEVADTAEQGEAANLLQALGIEVDERVAKLILGLVALLVLIGIWSGISSARRKAKQRADFENLMNNKD